MKPIQKPILLLATAASILLLAAATTPASAQDILHNNNFEDGSMGPWSVADGTDAGLYQNGDTPSNVAAAEASINFAPSGNFSLWEGRGGSFLVLSDPLPLATRGYDSVSISFNWTCRNATSTRRLHTEYSPDNGDTWVSLGFVNGPSTAFASGSGSYTRTSAQLTFTDEALFRFRFSDSGGAAGPFFIDDVVISATPAWDGEYDDRLFWDIDGSTAGAGGAQPAGIWDDTVTNWNAVSLGTGTATEWDPGRIAYFAAGNDATGEYDVTVDGSQAIGGLVFEQGTVTLQDGTDGAFELVADSSLNVASGLTANIEIPITEDSPDRNLLVNGPGVLNISGDLSHTGTTLIAGGNLILSGDNSAATGGILNNFGLVQFESPESINGTGVNVALRPWAVMAFGPSFGTEADLDDAIDRLSTTTGIIAVDHFETKDFDFDDLGLTQAGIGAVGTVDYTGIFTPGDTTYRLGGAGGTLRLNQKLTDGFSLEVGPGTLQLNGEDATLSSLSLPAGAILQNASDEADITVSFGISSTTTFEGNIVDGGDASLSLVKTGSGALTLSGVNDFSGSIEIGGGTLTLPNLNAWGGAGKDVTFSGETTLASSVSYAGGSLTVEEGATATMNSPSGILEFVDTSGDGDIICNISGTGTRRFLLGDASDFNGTLQARLGSNANQGTNINIQFSDIADAENSAIQFVNNTGGNNNSGQALTVAYNGTSALTFENRQIQILDRLAGNWEIRDNIIANNSSNSAHTWTINTDLLYTGGRDNAGIQSGRLFILSGSNTGDNTFSGVIDDGDGTYPNGFLGLSKTGAGKWIISGDNSYTGATTISAGTLLIKGDQSAATGPVAVNGTSTLGGSGTLGGDVTVAAGARLSPGESAGTLTILGDLDISAMAGGAGRLFFDLGPIAASDQIAVGGTLDIGTGVFGLSDFDFTEVGSLEEGDYILITSSGISGDLDTNDLEGTIGLDDTDITLSIKGNNIVLTVGEVSGTPYELWSGGAPFDGDANGDGVSNGMAFLLGAANPNASALGLLPDVSEDAGGLKLEFSMLNAAARGGASLAIEYSTSLATGSWTTVNVPDTSSTVADVVFTVSGTNPLDVTATIPASKAAGGKLFGRLKAEE